MAGTIGKGLVNPAHIDIYVVLGGLAGAIVWNIITWLLALPTSSSHALVGGVGRRRTDQGPGGQGGLDVLIWQGWMAGWGGLLLFIFLSPMIGMILGTSI